MILRIIKYIAAGVIFLLLVSIFGIYIGAHYPDSRPLTDAEKNTAQSVYGDALDLKPIRIAIDTLYSIGASKTLGNTIHLNSPLYKTLLVHELAHVWQYQTDGWGYIPESLIAQFGAFLRTGSRSGAYKWEEDYLAGKPWGDLNPEQQAESIAEYFYYRELGEKADAHQEYLKKELECFIPFLRGDC